MRCFSLNDGWIDETVATNQNDFRVENTFGDTKYLLLYCYILLWTGTRLRITVQNC
jgi:hypothetical protein